MRTTRRSCSLLVIAMALSTVPAFADSIEVTASAGMSQAKYAQRIKDLGEQIQLIKSKGLLSDADASKFMARQGQLKTTEEQVRKDGFPKGPTDDLEKAVTLLNSDVFAASHKSNPVKPGQAEKEVHDPNLVPAHPDANLKPNSGVVDKK